MSDETGWLLEKAPDKHGIAYIGVIDGLLGWTYDPNDALRLARRQDADKLCEIVDDCDKISEHCWPDMSATAEWRKPSASEIYAAATKLATQSGQVAGEKSEYFVTLEQLQNILAEAT